MFDPEDVGNNFFALRQLERDKLREEADEIRRVLNAELQSDTFKELDREAARAQKSNKPLTEEERSSFDNQVENEESSSDEPDKPSTSQVSEQVKRSGYSGFRSFRSAKEQAQLAASEAYRLKLLEKEQERKRQEELEKLDESDESVEWTRDRYDADVAIKWAKKYTKTCRKRTTYTDNAFQRNRTLVEMAKGVQPVDWENNDEDFLQSEQQYRSEPVPLYRGKFMDMCYPPMNEDFLARVVSFTRGAFYLSWKEIDEERREFEEKLRTDHVPAYLGLRSTFKGDVVAVRAGKRDVEWKRGVVKEVHKRANKIHVCLVEYGMELAIVHSDEGKTIFQEHYNKSDRGRVFFTCRFVLDGVDSALLDEGTEASDLLKGSMSGVEAMVRCSRIQGRTAFGKIYIKPEDDWYDVAAEIKNSRMNRNNGNEWRI